MAKVHGKKTVILINTASGGGSSKDISSMCNNSQLSEGAEAHDTTGYGADAKAKDGGLQENSFTLGGVYDNSTTDTPAALFAGMAGAKFQITRRLSGTGSGKEQQQFDAVLTSYADTSAVGDYVRWTSSWQIDGEVDHTAQTS